MSQSLSSSTRGLVSTRAAVRGKNHGHGRGRGQGRHLSTQSAGAPLESQTASSSSKPAKKPKPPLTHFISLSIGHHPSLRERISAFTTALQKADPPIPGLDESIIILPRRLHLTLGVMSLSPEPTGPNTAAPSLSPAVLNFNAESHSQSQPQPQSKTLSSALALLTALKPRIRTILGDHKLRVALDRMDIMKPDRGDLDRAHVMWLGPLLEGDDDARRLREVCALVNKEFVDAGLLVDERRPLKLHCTVINTTHRKPRSKTQRRQPFSYSSILASTAFKAISTDAPILSAVRTSTTATTTTATSTTDAVSAGHQKTRRPASVDFGVWEVDEIQICQMGSHGPEGEYVSCGGMMIDV